METVPVTCPSCFEVFEVPLSEAGVEFIQLDYDCEVCCRPMVIEVFPDGGVQAKSLDDL